jgi:hypothetical protein
VRLATKAQTAVAATTGLDMYTRSILHRGSLYCSRRVIR